MKKVIDITSKRMFVRDEDDYRFLNLNIYAIKEGMTRNECAFTLESMKDALPTFYNMPILAYYNPEIKDCEEHNTDYKFDLEAFDIVESYLSEDTESACGLIRESDTVEIVEYQGANWIRISGAIWTKYNRELAKLLRSSVKKKVSVEINIRESHFENGIEIIDKFDFCGVTILGEHIAEGIPDAHLLVTDVIDENKKDKFVFSMQKTFSKKDDNSDRDINLALTRDKASNDDWGEIDKTKLRNDLLNAKNSAQLIRACYLYVGKDYINAPSEELKYPICQIKNGELVYNLNGVESASSFLMSNRDEPYFSKVLSKLNTVRIKLGLKPLSKKKKEVQRMSLDTRNVLFEKDQFTFFASTSEDGETKVYVSEKTDDENEKVFAVNVTLAYDEEFIHEKGKEGKLDDGVHKKMSEDKHDDDIDDEKDNDCKDDEHDDEDDDDKDEAKKFLAECNLSEILTLACKERDMAKEEKVAVEEKLSKAEKDFADEKAAKETAENEVCKLNAEIVSDKFELKEDEKEQVVKMACEKKMSLEDVEKEVVFLQFTKQKGKFKESIIEPKKPEIKDVFDELNNI